MAGHYINTIEDQVTGKPVNGAVIKVYQDGATIVGDAVTSGTLETIYSDDGVTTINQTTSPLTTGADGEFDFYTDASRVIVAVLVNDSGVAVWNDIDIPGSGLAGDITTLTARVDKHDTVFGLAASAVDLGTFTGTTIADNVAVKVALQSLETAVEGSALDGAITASGLTMSTARILGRTTASTGAVEELTAGAGLTLSAGSLVVGLDLADVVTISGTPATNSVGFLGAPQIADQDDYTLALTDSGGHYYHVSATPHTLTIPANASVAFPIGTVIAIVNENGAGAITLAITTDTLRWGSSTGSRTIAANGTASLLKVTATVWRLTGDGIT